MDDRDETVNRAQREAYRFLASRSRTEREVRDRLRLRGYMASDVDLVVQQLVAEGYLDDRKVALDWARYRLQGKPLGRRRLAWEMQRRGVNADMLEEILNDIYAEFDQVALAEQALRKRLRVAKIPQSISEWQKLSRYLIGLGFEGEIVDATLSKVLGSVIPRDRMDDEEQV